MNLRPVLIDTSSWVEALRVDGESEVRNRVAGHLQSGGAACCELVMLELWNGARGASERKKLMEIERNLIMLEITPRVWEKARELSKRARTAGHTITATDLVIAACALVHGAVMDHCDNHYDIVMSTAVHTG